MLHEPEISRRHRSGFWLAAVLSLLLPGCMQPAVTPDKPFVRPVSPTQTTSYRRDIKPILEEKCIACHACYDAPCQLNLTSSEGLLRGANKKAVYDAARLTATEPTRLYVDATTPAQWREKGFTSVFNEQGSRLEDNLEYSLLYHMITLGKEHPLAPGSPVPESIELGLQRKNECPLPAEFQDYARSKPEQGMPLAITGLNDREYTTLREWILEGALIDEQPAVPTAEEQRRIDEWERFFNRVPLRNQLVSRYLYEHYFLAHFYFEGLDSRNFFELVRSSSAPGEPVRIIPTRRPDDDPGQSFYYRLRPIQGTIVEKTHITYALSQARMRRLEKLFLAPQWDIEKLPGYSRAYDINPFKTFAAIPARGRYQFLLDTAQYTVMTFIRGPVCRGQVATNVIDDQFYVLFQAPDADLSVTDPGYMSRITPYLALTGASDGAIATLKDWVDHKDDRNKYIRLRGEYYREQQPRGPGLDDIWDGDGTNNNAALTVFRNFDNAMVVKGFVGAVSKTLWVMDYPMLERTYYELVVNYDVFGSAGHQAETRLYFDLIRSGAENNFLHFMPPGVRTAMRKSWYQGTLAQLKINSIYEIVNETLPVQIAYRTADPKTEFVELVTARLKSLAGPDDVLNRCAHPPCYREGAGAAERQADAALQTLTSTPASRRSMHFVDFMPDVAFLRISTGRPSEDLAYTLIRNKAHTNVAFMLAEEKRRKPGKDTLTAYRGLLGSYPNFLFNVPLSEIGTFASALRAANTREQFLAVIDSYGLSRTHPQVWENFHWFVDFMRRRHPIQAGVYDLNRFKKVSDLPSDENG
ncbi:MAG: fatty acid cis/trans isomerase [Gammaproteobacteria bacterium]